MSRPEKITVWLILLGGAVIFLWGAWLPLKAQLAQHLLNRAWRASQLEGNPVKPWPWADTWPVGRLHQHKLGVDEIVLQGDSGEVLAFGPGLLPQAGKPGTADHIILAGHRDTSFAFLERLQKGDTLKLEGPGVTHQYRVSSMTVVPASRLYLDQASPGLLTLITCYPFHSINPGTQQRYVVQAELVQDGEAGSSGFSALVQ